MPRRPHVRDDVPPALKKVFTIQRVRNAWAKTVRPGLRQQPLEDLHDYLDYHRNIHGISARVRSEIIDGVYRPRPPVVVTLEKSQGVCRRIVMPSPEDAIALQSLVDFLEPFVQSKRPSPSAYYSRSHGFPSVDRVDGTFSYPWWTLWPEFQKKIWKFSRKKSYTVVTDVANYYDTIPLDNLRRQIAKLAGLEGASLDFLFFILESFVWRPDYIPHPGTGLPQINFDTPRLLAHAYLFPIDALLVGHLGDDFVRWMDDIDFGVDSVHEGRILLKKIDETLASYGVRLNSGKTKIMAQREAAKFFWISDNRALGVIQSSIKNRAKGPMATLLARRALEKSFPLFLQKLSSGRVGQWSKVYKRYINLLGQVSSAVVDPEIAAIISDSPEMRDSCFLYLSRLGYSMSRFQLIENYMLNQCIDDASMFSAMKVLVEWMIPPSSIVRKRIADIADKVAWSGRTLLLQG